MIQTPQKYSPHIFLHHYVSSGASPVKTTSFLFKLRALASSAPAEWRRNPLNNVCQNKLKFQV